MPWTKVTLSQGRIQYNAPPEAAPMLRIIYDPRVGQPKWTVHYEWLAKFSDTVSDVEEAMRTGQGLV